MTRTREYSSLGAEVLMLYALGALLLLAAYLGYGAYRWSDGRVAHEGPYS